MIRSRLYPYAKWALFTGEVNWELDTIHGFLCHTWSYNIPSYESNGVRYLMTGELSQKSTNSPARHWSWDEEAGRVHAVLDEPLQFGQVAIWTSMGSMNPCMVLGKSVNDGYLLISVHELYDWSGGQGGFNLDSSKHVVVDFKGMPVFSL